jgi:hypothetical protein
MEKPLKSESVEGEVCEEAGSHITQKVIFGPIDTDSAARSACSTPPYASPLRISSVLRPRFSVSWLSPTTV